MHQIPAVTLDIQAAYDTVWRAGLLRKLAKAAVEGYLVRWTQSFLTDRIAMLIAFFLSWGVSARVK